MHPVISTASYCLVPLPTRCTGAGLLRGWLDSQSFADGHRLRRVIWCLPYCRAAQRAFVQGARCLGGQHQDGHRRGVPAEDEENPVPPRWPHLDHQGESLFQAGCARGKTSGIMCRSAAHKSGPVDSLLSTFACICGLHAACSIQITPRRDAAHLIQPGSGKRHKLT